MSDRLGFSGWIDDNLEKDSEGVPIVGPESVDLLVRTYNVCEKKIAKDRGLLADGEYDARLWGAAQKFVEDWPHDGGVVALQEAYEKLDGGSRPYVSQRFAEELRDVMARVTGMAKRNCRSWTGEELGFAWDEEKVWGAHSAGKIWPIGKRKINAFRWGQHYLAHKLFVHKTQYWAVSVFNTHLANGGQDDRRETRSNQIDRCIELINATVTQDELPPVLVGDMNFGPDEVENYDRLNSRFQIVGESGLSPDTFNSLGGIDHIWVGRPEAFPQTRGSLIPIRWHGSPSNKLGVDLPSARLSDHPSPAVSFRAVDSVDHRLAWKLKHL